MANVTVFCFLASYAVAFGLEWTRLLRRTQISRLVMVGFGIAGLVAHTIYLFQRSRQIALPPLLSSEHDWLLVLAWLMIVLYVFLTLADRNLAVGLFLLPLVLILISWTYFVSDAPIALISPDQNPAHNARYHWAFLHGLLLVFGTAGVVLGFVLSMMYLVQHRRLRHKQAMQNGLTLPSLARLARLNWWSVVISIPLLTLGLGIGVGLGIFPNKDSQAVSLLDPVVIGNGLVWMVMVVFFCWLIRSRRPAGTQVAWLTIWAFGFLLVTLIGSQALSGNASSSFHSPQTQLSIFDQRTVAS